MLALISPAKTLDFETPPTTESSSQPQFLDDSEQLIKTTRKLAPHQLSSLMGISDKLGHLNFDRFANWQRPFKPGNAKQALLAFKGDVYTGLAAENFEEADFQFAQQHLRILSGLYGLLKPLDLIQPYRLEMGTKLSNPRGANLYQFWDARITEALNRDLAKLAQPVIINLASNEYFRAVQTAKLHASVITPVFKDWKNGRYKIISFYAKKARGMMSAFMIRERITRVEDLQLFSEGGYCYDATRSTESEWVFTRKAQ